jgi:glycosyltransferase involved in cell wall biosynthesis
MAPDYDIALLYRSPDPLRSAHSGSVAGLAEGLSSLGLRVALLNADPPRPVIRAFGALQTLAYGHRLTYSTRAARLATAIAPLRARHIRQTPTVLMVSDSGCPVTGPAITYEDMTVAQAARFPDYLGLPVEELAPWRKAQQRLYERARGCCVGSRWTAESVVGDYGIPSEKVHVVGRGHGFRVDVPDRDWRSPRFLFTGRDWARKNGDAVVRAFGRLRSEHPDATLDVVGNHPRLDRPGVRGHGLLSLHDRADRERLAGLFRAATCFVMPSQVEAFGISYVEAASFGLPSIGTRVGGASSAIGQRGGILVWPRDDEQLLAAMRRLAAPDEAARMGAAAAARAALFSWPRIAERVAQVLIDGRRPTDIDAG